MKIIFTPKAAQSLYFVAEFVESLNTPGSGKRYVRKFRGAIEQLAQPNLKYALCNHQSLALMNYSCRNYNDWVIAFKIENNKLTVYEILHSKILS